MLRLLPRRDTDLFILEDYIIRQSYDSILVVFHFGTIDGRSPGRKTQHMTRYDSLIGKRVELSYRAGDMLLSAAGVVVADSGESVSLEDRFTQRGILKTLRVEVPYPCIVRIAEAEAAQPLDQATP